MNQGDQSLKQRNTRNQKSPGGNSKESDCENAGHVKELGVEVGGVGEADHDQGFEYRYMMGEPEQWKFD